jgi:hypothetical protein
MIKYGGNFPIDILGKSKIDMPPPFFCKQKMVSGETL